MSKIGTIRKEKGIEICADLLFEGRTRKEIVEQFTKSYKVSVASIDNWLKAARPVVAKRQAEVKEISARVDREAAEASAKRLNMSKERLLERMAAIIYHDPGKPQPPVVDKDGEIEIDAPEPVEGLRIRAQDVIRAVEVVNKMLGYNAPDKAEIDHTSGGQPIHTTLIIRPRDRKTSGD